MNAVATPNDRATLGTLDLNLKQVDEVAKSIADACMNRLVELEGVTKRRVTRGYTGVGARVQKVISTYPTLCRTDGRQTRIGDFQKKTS